MHRKYDPKSIEGRWQKVWEDRGCFEARVDSPGEEFYILEMFPYPSGRLHYLGRRQRVGYRDQERSNRTEIGYEVETILSTVPR